MALRETGSFNNVNVVIDTSSEYAKASPNGYQVIFELDEKRLNLSTNTGMDIDKENFWEKILPKKSFEEIKVTKNSSFLKIQDSSFEKFKFSKNSSFKKL